MVVQSPHRVGDGIALGKTVFLQRLGLMPSSEVEQHKEEWMNHSHGQPEEEYFGGREAVLLVRQLLCHIEQRSIG
jgi:hypothetical protein